MISYMKEVLASGIFYSSTDKHKELNIFFLFSNIKNIYFDTVLCKFFILKQMSFQGLSGSACGLWLVACGLALGVIIPLFR